MRTGQGGPILYEILTSSTESAFWVLRGTKSEGIRQGEALWMCPREHPVRGWNSPIKTSEYIYQTYFHYGVRGTPLFRNFPRQERGVGLPDAPHRPPGLGLVRHEGLVTAAQEQEDAGDSFCYYFM